MRAATPFLALVLALALSGCAQKTTHGVPNLAVVSEGIWRGGEPSAEGWQYLRTLGVTNVVKLNAEADQTLPGIAIQRFPITTEQQLLGKGLKEVLPHAVAAIGRGTFVHCEHGQDRTGLVVALWRVQVEHWTKGRAEAEMLRMGFHKDLHGLWEFWENYQP